MVQILELLTVWNALWRMPALLFALLGSRILWKMHFYVALCSLPLYVLPQLLQKLLPLLASLLQAGRLQLCHSARHQCVYKLIVAAAVRHGGCNLLRGIQAGFVAERTCHRSLCGS